jgi:hypothetical protein
MALNKWRSISVPKGELVSIPCEVHVVGAPSSLGMVDRC